MDGNVGGPCLTFSMVSLRAASSEAISVDWLVSAVLAAGGGACVGAGGSGFGPSWSNWKLVFRNVPRTVI